MKEQLFQYDLKKYWMKEYEESRKNKIVPRDSLQNVYKYMIEHGEFPECVRLFQVLCKFKKLI